MFYKKVWLFIHLLVAICFTVCPVWGAISSSENFTMIKETLNGGGLNGVSSTHVLFSSMGQPGGIGATAGTAQVITAGFLGSPGITTFDLTVTRAGAGSGTVTSNPAGIDCGSTCMASFKEGTEVTLTAAADLGSVFTGWSGGLCSGTGTCQVTMNDHAAVTATFSGPPTITTPPQTQTVWTGQSATFTLVAQGDGTLSYQWRKDGSEISGASSAQYTINPVTLLDAGDYTCVVSNFVGDTISSAATLTVRETVHITSHPTSQTVLEGAPVTFSVTAQGTAPITYQWKKDGANLTGETGADLTIGSVDPADAGSYACTVSNGGGSVASDPAVLTVLREFTITAAAGPGGAIAPSGGVTVLEGDDQAFIISPESHYYITEVLVDGSPVSLPNLPVGASYTHTFINVTQDHAIAAVFEIEQVTLTISTAGAGQGTTNPAAGQYEHDYGALVAIEAFPDSNSVFSGWTGDAAGLINPTTITMSGSKYVIANFSENNLEAPRATLVNTPLPLTNRTQYSVDVGGIGVTAYKWKVDGGSYGAEASVTTPLNLPVTGEGEHTLYVIGRSASGGWQSESDPTTHRWTIDLTPSTAILCHCPCTETGNTSIHVMVGGENVRNYKYRLDEGTNSTYESYTTYYPISRPIQVTGLAAGPHCLEVIAEDRAGNWQDASQATRIDWTVNPDIPTAVMSGLPAPITTETGIDVRINGPAGGVEIDGFNYVLDQGDWVYSNAGQDIVENGLAEGTHTLYVNAHGVNGLWQDGGTGTDRDRATHYEWDVDITPPASPALTASTGDPASTSAYLSWMSVEDNQERYILKYSYPMEGGTKTVVIDLFQTPGPRGTTETFMLTGLAPSQTYQFNLASVDAAGNESQWSASAEWSTANLNPIIDAFNLTDGQGTSGTNGQTRELKLWGQNICSAASYCIIRFLNSTHSFDLLSKGGDSTGIFVDIPKGAPVGVYHLKVVNKNGVSPISAQTYDVLPATPPLPEVLQVSPVVAENGRDIQIVLIGRHFTGALSVNLLPAKTSLIVPLTNVLTVDEGTIEAVVPAGIAEDIYQIRVETAAGSNQVSAAHYQAEAPIDLTGAANPMMTTGPVRMPNNGVAPINLILVTDSRPEVPQNNTTNMKITAHFDTGAVISDETDQPYNGVIHPPRQVPIEGLSENLDETAVAFTMGADQRLLLGDGQTITVLLEISLPGSKADPVVYYVEANGSLTLAGIDGEKNGIQYQAGGTVFNTRFNTPETGFTTFTMGVLLDHMSTLAVASQEQPGPTITSVYPIVGLTTGGDEVTITGADFLEGANLFIDGQDTPYTLVDAQTITYITPPHDQGVVDITVTNPDDQTATLEDGFLYVRNPTSGHGGGGGCFIGSMPIRKRR